MFANRTMTCLPCIVTSLLGVLCSAYSVAQPPKPKNGPSPKPKVAQIPTSKVPESPKPNIVVILCDDLGWGDVHCYGGKIETPHMDSLAQQGMRFTDAHTNSSVCSPTRYGLLTGRYAWRSKLSKGVLGGLSPRLIEPDRMTIASMLREQCYYTACIGKWHLGMDWVLKPGKTVTELGVETPEQVHNVDYAQPIKNGPNSVGFDYYYGISASLDMVPFSFIENDRITALPTVEKEFLLMHERTQGGKTRKGPGAPEFEAVDVLPTFTRKAIEVIDQRASDARSGKPFFLYIPLASPHTPILPTAEWVGKSGLNPYADFVMQTDAAIGQIMEALEKNGLTKNTLVLLTSDNGCSPQAKFEELEAMGHRPSGPFRGNKADLFEGGHRVPFIARWPGQIPAGTENSQLICLVDVLATIAELRGYTLPSTAGEDSISFWPALKGDRTASQKARRHLVSHSINGSFAIRSGRWKLLIASDSGGWSAPRPGSKEAEGLPTQQLYNLVTDIGERSNLADRGPNIAAELTTLLRNMVENGRSTPGPKQPNNREIELRELPRKPAANSTKSKP